MDDVSIVLSLAAVVLAALSLAAVMWQILRFEASQPVLGWSLRFEHSAKVVNGRTTVELGFAPSGPAVLYEVEAHAWGAASVSTVTERARMTCESEELVAEVICNASAEGYAGFAWLEQSPLARKPVRRVLRARVSGGQSVLQEWRWYRIPRLPGRAQGRWVERRMRVARRAQVPEEFGPAASRMDGV